MFTGIITDIGTVLEVDARNDGRRLRIGTIYDPESIDLGASIMCEGVCLTVTDKGTTDGQNWFDVFAAQETLAVTRLGDWGLGRRINLERSLKAGDELGGHVVSGHVDGLATIVERRDIGEQTTFVFEAPTELIAFISKKGSVALNGTSLTVNTVEGNRFSVHLIPHTLAATNWSDYREGETVNLEVDQMARYAARLMAARGAAPRAEPKMTDTPHLLIVEARFYDDLADAQLEGALAAIAEAGGTADVIAVPGALEIPAAIKFALEAGRNGSGPAYDGYVALGCVIRGETTHYEIVSNESARALMELTIRENVALGNGILTVENDAQAWRRAKMSELNKGGGAAQAALAMVALKNRAGVA